MPLHRIPEHSQRGEEDHAPPVGAGGLGEPARPGRGVRLDVHAIDRNGRHFDVEIQRDSDGVSPRRSRHNGAILDMENISKGGDPQQLPETYVIFVCERDPFGCGIPVYTVENRVKETGASFDDGMHYVFSNAAYLGDDDFGRLSRDLRETDPKKMHFAPLAQAAAQAKSGRKGVSEMCRIMEEFRDECIQKGKLEDRIETVRSLLKFMEPDDIAKRMNYPLDFVKDVAANRQGKNPGLCGG